MSRGTYVTILILIVAAAGLFIAGFILDRTTTETTPVAKKTIDQAPTTEEENSGPKEPGLARLTDARGGTGFGEARLTFENQTYTLSTFVEGLPKPASGTSYAGWLEGASGALYVGKFIPHKSGELDGWALGYRAKEDLSGYSKFFVAVQTGENQTPGQKLLEGEFGR